MNAAKSLPCANLRHCAKTLAKSLTAGLFLSLACGCSRAPELSVLGSYFPSWIVCLAIAIGCTFGAHALVTRLKLARELWSLPLVYSSLLCLLSCLFWLILFS